MGPPFSLVSSSTLQVQNITPVSGAGIESSSQRGCYTPSRLGHLILELTFSLLLLDSWPASPCKPRGEHQTPDRGLPRLGPHEAPISQRTGCTFSFWCPLSLTVITLLQSLSPMSPSLHLSRSQEGYSLTLLVYMYLQGEHLRCTPGFLMPV